MKNEKVCKINLVRKGIDYSKPMNSDNNTQCIEHGGDCCQRGNQTGLYQNLESLLLV